MATPPRTRTSSRSAERKTDRIELRVTPSAKAVIQRATALSGLTAGDLAYGEAQRIIEQHEVMVLRGADAEAFARSLLEPPEPSPELVAALRRRLELDR